MLEPPVLQESAVALRDSEKRQDISIGGAALMSLQLVPLTFDKICTRIGAVNSRRDLLGLWLGLPWVADILIPNSITLSS